MQLPPLKSQRNKVNTVEYLNNENDEPDNESKWHPDEWGYSDGHHSELAELSRLLWENHKILPSEAFFLDTLISAMKQLKGSGILGKRTEDITFLYPYRMTRKLKTSKFFQQSC